jgi:hypothetical protein
MEAEDIENIQLKPNIAIEGSRSFSYLETYVFKNSGKCSADQISHSKRHYPILE